MTTLLLRKPMESRVPRATPRFRLQLGPCLAVALLFFAAPLSAQYDSKLQYQKRGNYSEGLKPKPVSGYDLELLSALVDYREPMTGWPTTLHLNFYLPSAQPVFVTVRQLRPKTIYYWLDEVVPDTQWRDQAINKFSWPTETVLKEIGSISPSDLGAVVRLATRDPSKSERIAPAVLFHTRAPQAVTAYRFTFKTNGTAWVTATLYQGEKVVHRQPQTEERAGSPFTIRWDTQGNPEGEYRLVLSGYFFDNSELSKEIVFYHRAVWKSSSR